MKKVLRFLSKYLPDIVEAILITSLMVFYQFYYLTNDKVMLYAFIGIAVSIFVFKTLFIIIDKISKLSLYIDLSAIVTISLGFAIYDLVVKNYAVTYQLENPFHLLFACMVLIVLFIDLFSVFVEIGEKKTKEPHGKKE